MHLRHWHNVVIFLVFLFFVVSCNQIKTESSASDSAQLRSQATIPLFQNNSGWYLFVQGKGRVDPKPARLVSVNNGVVHILDAPRDGEDFGYIATNTSYRCFNLSFEYRFGVGTWGRREGRPRDSGVLYHLSGTDRIWPNSLEFQIIEPHVASDGKRMRSGDLWILPDYRHIPVYDANAPQSNGPNSAWNKGKIEVDSGFLNNNQSQPFRQMYHTVNGRLVRGTSLLSLGSGRIALQLEGAEMYFRNIQLTPLECTDYT